MNLRTALAASGGFFAGVLLIAILGGARPAGPPETVTVTTPGQTVTAELAPDPRPTDPGPDQGPTGEVELPSVVGERLDVARAVLEDRGLEVDTRGGGAFGIVDESNWVVTAQVPAVGTVEPGATVVLRVDRG
ncbi:PASTA domain-containing protein [Conexibacter sp. SYSU D00693]|uniref:PASTA domain-containing protein n=1 Tax=Conexibacter sp. SYSU D00693 TaxID=2812560 RepID=UPI00196B2016|nr:PASTA domain-containing protein [Conexibacter sp. SYSU D00693]